MLEKGRERAGKVDLRCKVCIAQSAECACAKMMLGSAASNQLFTVEELLVALMPLIVRTI